MTVIVKVVCRNTEEAESIKSNIEDTLGECPFRVNASYEIVKGGKVNEEEDK
jgi:hypothetical protein